MKFTVTEVNCRKHAYNLHCTSQWSLLWLDDVECKGELAVDVVVQLVVQWLK